MNYKSQCPTCNAPAEVSQLCNNRTLDQIVANFKAVRPHILKLCKEDAKIGNAEAGASPPRVETKGKSKKKSSPYFKPSLASHQDSDGDGDVVPDRSEYIDSETPKRKGQRRSNYQKTREKIAANAEDMTSSLSNSPERHVKPYEPANAPSATSSSSSTSSPPATAALNRSNEENIDPSYQPPKDDDAASQSDEDEDGDGSVVVATPSRSSLPSTSRGLGSSSAKEGATPATRSEKLDCPVCGVPISSKHINVHLDSCLTKSEEKQTRNRAPKRKPLPKIISSLLSDKELRKKLREHGLNAQGNRSMLNKRFLDFTLMYNAQCDSTNPMPVEAIVKEFNKMDKLKAQPNPTHDEQRLKVSRSQTEEEIDKSQKHYLKSHSSHFQELIKNTKKRINAKSKKAAEAKDTEQSKPDLLPAAPSLPSALNHDTIQISASSSENEEDVPLRDNSAARDMIDRDCEASGEKLRSGLVDGRLDIVVASSGETSTKDVNAVDSVPVNNLRPTSENNAVDKKPRGSGPSRHKLGRRDKVPADDSRDYKNKDKTKSSTHGDMPESAPGDDHDDDGGRDVVAVDVAPMVTKLDASFEEQMDVTEDELSPVFGSCSVGSSSSGKSRSGATAKTQMDIEKRDANLEMHNHDAKKSDAPNKAGLLSTVPSPPNLLNLDVDAASDGSSLLTFETFSEASGSGSHGDVPSPEITCIPESPEASEESRPRKRLGRRKRKQEVAAEDDGSEGAAQGGSRVTRLRKRGKTSTD